MQDARPKDFFWTDTDREAGFPALKAAIAATDSPVLQATYVENMRWCFAEMFGSNMRVIQRHLAEELLRREVTTIPNLFGPIAITAEW